MTTATPAVHRRRVPRIDTQAVLCTVVLGIVAFCVVFPVLLVVLQSFQVAPPGQPAKYGLDGWRAAFDEPGLRGALLNTLKVTFVRQLLSLPLAVLIAWLLARTDLPGRRWLEFALWAAFFLPSFTVTLSWILLLDPEYGLINTSLARLVGTAPFNIYSFWGIVWVHVLTGSLTVKVILLTPAFRHMNASFEEASRVAGASTLRTALRITVPVMAPVILSVLLLGTMVSLQTFEVEQVLGLPFRFFVFSTMIYALLGTFMKLFGFFHIADPWTLNNWKTVLTDELFLRSLHNTVVLAVGTAVAAVVVHSLIAYIAVRTRYAGRRALDFISWLPFTVPGIILGLALLWLFLGVEMLKPLYGTTTLLIVAGVIAGMPLGVQIIKSGLLQLGSELEEASRIAGASWWATYRRIVLRLMAPTLMAVAMITFVGAARNIGNFALLTTSANRPLSILQIDYIAQRKFEEAVVVACIIMFISLAGALLARLLGLRSGLG